MLIYFPLFLLFSEAVRVGSSCLDFIDFTTKKLLLFTFFYMWLREINVVVLKLEFTILFDFHDIDFPKAENTILWIMHVIVRVRKREGERKKKREMRLKGK